MAFRRRQTCARGQADEIERERHAVRLVEIGDAPYQPSLGVTPSAVVLDVKVSDREHPNGLRQLGQCLRRLLRPPIEGRAKEAERVRGHRLVLVVELVLAQRYVASEPSLEAARGFDYVESRGHGRYCRLGRTKLVEGFAGAAPSQAVVSQLSCRAF